MKRHPALHDLSRDHHGLLLHCRAIRWRLAKHRRAPPAECLLADFLRDWQQEALPHFTEEESYFLPLYRTVEDTLQPVYERRLLAEHTALRQEVAALQAAIEVGEPWQARLGRIGQQLHDHIRWEERVLFQHVQATLPPATLAAIGEASRAFRLAQRPHAIGPRG